MIIPHPTLTAPCTIHTQLTRRTLSRARNSLDKRRGRGLSREQTEQEPRIHII